MHDWERIAAQEAFYGVLTDPRFRSGALTPESIAEFYDSGAGEIAGVVDRFNALMGRIPMGGVALDIGCGVGRLARAMRAHAATVYGYDVSETMLALARKHAGEGVEYVRVLPHGPLDWINCYIVLQHIPPQAGLSVLRDAFSRAAPGCLASIHATAWRDSRHTLSPLGSMRRSLSLGLARLRGDSPERLIQMFDYNFSDVLRVFVEAGFGPMHLEPTDHGGHHGFWIFAQKTA